MAYNENIPQATDNPSQSQSQILDNFQEISIAFNTNHGNFNSANQGKHAFLQMPEQSSAPATSANEMALYTKESALTSVAEMFIRKESNGNEIEFTSFLGATNGWTRLPSGILLKWGTGVGSGTHTTLFPTAPTIPVYTAVYTGFVITADASSTPNTFATFQAVSPIGITVYGSRRTATSATTVNYRYLVIGS